MTVFEDLKLDRFRRDWHRLDHIHVPRYVRVPPPNLPAHMVEGWRSVKDDVESFTTIDDEERDDFDEWVWQ
jgi:hypothetical protein